LTATANERESLRATMSPEPTRANGATGEAPPAARRTLCGASVSAIVLGTARLGSVLPDAFVSAGARERAFRYLDAMVEAGCNALDLAASYQIGGTERLVGRWLRARANRDRLFLIGKGGHPYPVVQPRRLTPRAVGDDLDATLRRLGTDRLDLYLLHRDDARAPLEPLASALASFHAQRKIAAWGVSNWKPERIQRIDTLVRQAGGPPIAASSPHLSLLTWTRPPWSGSESIAGDAGRDARTFHEATQLPALAWSPLGHGAFSTHGGGQRASYESPENTARRRRAEELATKRGVSAVQIALAYVLSQPFPTFAITATRSAENMKKNLAAAAVRLSPDEVRWLENGELLLASSAR
jgi:aryl-alcohol dehydrogenase-like predicted oxidoreductase